MKQYQRTFIIWALFIVMILAVFTTFSQGEGQGREKKFSEVVAALESGEVSDVTIKGQAFTGTLTDGTRFTTVGVLTDNVLESLKTANQKHSTEYTIEKEEGNHFWIFPDPVVAHDSHHFPLFLFHAAASVGRWQGHVVWQKPCTHDQ